MRTAFWSLDLVSSRTTGSLLPKGGASPPTAWDYKGLRCREGPRTARICGFLQDRMQDRIPPGAAGHEPPLASTPLVPSPPILSSDSLVAMEVLGASTNLRERAYRTSSYLRMS